MTTGERVEAYLLARGFKRKNGELNGNCPWRAGADSESFWVKIEPDGEHGTYKDFSHDAHGSLYELAEQLGIEINRPAAQQTKRAYSGLEDYAAAHYAPVEAFTRLGWFETEHHGRPAVAIPTTTGTRYRFLDGAKDKPAFIHDKGYERSWYRLKPSVEFAKSEGLPLVLCNGEASVAVGQWYRIPATAQTSSGEKTLAPALLGQLKALWDGGRIIIALDCDKAGRDNSEKLAIQLMDAGFVVAVVDLGVGDKGDLCDFCGLYSGAEGGVMPALLALATFTQPTRENAVLRAAQALAPQITEALSTLKKLGTKDPSAAERLRQLKNQIDTVLRGMPSESALTGDEVGDMQAMRYQDAKANRGRMTGIPSGITLLDRRTNGFRPGLNVILGATGMGKSTMMASIAGYLTLRGYRGVVMPTEMSPDEWADCAAAYIAAVNTSKITDGNLDPDEEIRFIDAVNLASQRIDYVTGASPSVQALDTQLAQFRTERPIDYVIVDSVSNIVKNAAAATGNSSIAGEQVYSELQELVMRVKVPFILSHQITGRAVAIRDNKVPNIYDGAGSSAVENYARCLITMYRHDYYVGQNLAQPAPEFFPDGTAALRVAKLRGRANDASKLIIVDAVLGQGFYDRQPAAIAKKSY